MRRKVITPEAVDPLRDFHGNQFERAVATAFYWMRQHSRQVVLGLILVVVVGTASLAFFIYRDYREQKSLTDFEELMKSPVMASGSGAEKVAIEKLEKYEREFPNDHAQLRAGLKKVDLLIKTGEKEKAGDALVEIARIVETPELSALFSYRAGLLFEEKGKFAKAESAYSNASQKLMDEGGAAALARFGQARALILLNKDREGREVMKKMLEIKDVESIADLRIAAAAFLIQHGK
ncbi:MAG TPA: hypothetical protein PKE49_04890 [Leptospiraceae bacterium]|nr:hypothetical protein [Leptospirales bacterium]HMU84608.1 hypothetical protein [Leptospiraceae bacterium]HMW59576.1 hypothetical protein [Leptospiraceae bacterium]HMX55836.1 hypothetical protein [Leptospiraceae bacterium]HMY45705.1 hypothetical protein [Leptospiraceae bacterium]